MPDYRPAIQSLAASLPVEDGGVEWCKALDKLIVLVENARADLDRDWFTNRETQKRLANDLLKDLGL